MKHSNLTSSIHYAKALYELCVENNDDKNITQLLNNIANDLNLVAGVIENNSQLILFTKHPCIDSEKKVQLVKNTFEQHCHKLVLNLLVKLTIKQNIDFIGLIAQEYNKILNSLNNVVIAKITLATKTEDNKIENLKARIKENVGMALEFEVDYDPDILGGVVLQLGDFVIDGSVRQRLGNIKKILINT